MGILCVELHFPENGSLKGKRKYLKSARALGMTTIKVIDPESALAELARVLEQATGGESV